MHNPKMLQEIHPRLWVTLLMSILVFCPGSSFSQGKSETIKAQLHASTDWQLLPSFKYDLLCAINTLTADSFYLDYYKDEYDRLAPKLTPAAQLALANLKRKIKDEGKNIISASLCLYFSAVDDETPG